MKKFLLFMVVFIFLVSAVWGQVEFRWTGANSDDWEDPDNWDVIDDHLVPSPAFPGESPRTDDIVIIDVDILSHGVQLANDITIKDLTIESGIQVYIDTNSKILTVTDQTVLNGIVSILPSGAASTSLMNITNLTVAPASNAGIDNSNVRMNGTLVSMDTSSDAIPIIIAPVTGDIGYINAGNRPISMTIDNNAGPLIIGNIESAGNITVNVGNSSDVTIGDIFSGGDVAINVGTGSTINASDITANVNFSLTGSSPLAAVTVDVTGTSAINLNITTTGAQTYTGAVTLGGTGTRTLTGTTVTLGSITGAAHSLMIAGDGVLNGGSGINVLSVSGTAVINQNITTTGAQTYTLAVTLGGDVILTTGTTVTLGSITGAANSLAIMGVGVLNGGSGINVLSVSGAATINADIATTGNQTYTGAVTLGGDVILTGTTVTLGSITGNTHSLTVAGNGVLNGGSDINVLSVSGAATINADITTTGDQDYGNVTLGGAGTRTLTGTTVTLGSITGAAHSLTIAGDGVLNGGSGINVLSVSGTAVINQNITTTGAQTYTLAVTLGGDVILTTGTTVTLGSITGAANSLAIMGAGVLNGGSGINVLSVSGAATINADITTTGNQTYTGAVTLGGTGTRTLTGTTVTLGSITGAANSLTVAGDGVLNGGSGINVLSVSGAAVINANITTTGAQTYTEAVTLGGNVILDGVTVTLGFITGNGRSLTIAGDGVLNGGSGINVLSVSGAAAINADITTTGNQTYTGTVTLGGAGTRTLTSTSGGITADDIITGTDIYLRAHANIITQETTVSGIVRFETDEDIIVTGKVAAFQLIMIAAGTVTVDDEIDIDLLNTGNEGFSAAIYIEADTFDVTTTTADSIFPGGTGGQLCLVLGNSWTDSNSVVDGARWHQHITISLTGKHLVYGDGTEPSGLTLGTYVVVLDTDIKTTFSLNSGFNIYIYNAASDNISGLTFKTSGLGFIEFLGTNEFEKLTLESGSGGIRLVDSDVTITGDFDTNNAILTLSGSTGSSIKAANINLDGITALSNQNLTLEAVSGDINFNGPVGAPVGNITVVTSTGVINIGVDITTSGAQTYSGQVELNGTGARIFTGTTVTLGSITGNAHSLTVNGNGVLNGGSGINVLSVSGTAAINADIAAAGAQTYSGTVTLGGNVELAGTTVTLGSITGNAHSLTITGNGIFNGGSGINNLSIFGTAVINADITAAGNQTYTEAAILNGSNKRTISSQNGDIEFKSTLGVAVATKDIIELSAASGNITVSGKVTAYQLIAKAPAGIVSVDEIAIDLSNHGNEGENAAIYIVANDFVVTAAPSPPYLIVPGGSGGHLCLNLNKNIPWEDNKKVVDGDEGMPGTLGARWHQHLLNIKGKILYSFTEDWSGNGRLDRIRVQANVALNGDFSGFDVSVEDYEIDRTQGTKGFQMVSAFTNALLFDNDSFYIYLIEKLEISGGNTPLWSITENESLANMAGSKVGDPEVDINIKPIDTIPPRIAYTLTLPGHPQTYVQMSETVVSSSGADVSASFGGLFVSSVNQAEPDNLGYIFNLSDSFNINDLADINIGSATLQKGYFQIDAVDKEQRTADLSAADPESQPPKYPLNWGYKAYAKVYDNGTIKNATGAALSISDVFIPPNKLLTADMMSNLAQGILVAPNSDPVIRRVTDVLVSRVPSDTGDENYFAWPVWARFKTPLNTDDYVNDDVFLGQKNTGTGIIWQFDGTSYLETRFIDTNDGIELQTRINNNLAGNPVLFWTTADIPVEYRNPKEAAEVRKAGGLWLPNVLTNPLYNYVPMSDGINVKPADSSSSKLFNYDIAADDLVIDNSAKFEFIFRFSGASDMFIARLDIPRGAVIPANWYTFVRPFVFDIQNMRRQRGGVTILNNVINSDKREVTLIRYHLMRPGRVTVQIYTLDGTMVKSLRRNEQREAGEWTDGWDGTNNGGRAVARGMYFVRVVGPDIDEIRKIMVVK